MQRYISGFFLIGCCIAAPLNGSASCDQSASAAINVSDKDWVKNDQLIYGLDEKGRLISTRLNSKKMTILKDHHFNYGSDFHISANGRYIYYSGFKSHFEGYLYDINSGKEQPVPGNADNFSPDSSKLVQIDKALHIIKIANLHEETIAFPVASQEPAYDRFVDPHWSLDGTQIYFVFIRHPNPEYYNYNLATKAFTKIDGFYDDTIYYEHHFIENGKPIVLYKEPCMQWQCGGNPLLSSKGDIASVDPQSSFVSSEHGLTSNESYQLNLKKKDGSVVTIDKGEYTNCSGVNIRINAWLKDGNYLIYSLSAEPYVYGIRENKKARLFESRLPFYGWHEE